MQSHLEFQSMLDITAAVCFWQLFDYSLFFQMGGGWGSDRGVNIPIFWLKKLMVRKLKYHEQKLLKKTNFFEWPKQANPNEALVRRRYHIATPTDYLVYNRLAGMIGKLTGMLSCLAANDPVRAELTINLLDKLWDMGIISDKNSLAHLRSVSAASIARRRLAVIMHARLKMAESVSLATRLIQQGHVRVGPECITNEAFLVSRVAEQWVTWSLTSKFRAKIADYQGQRDDFDLMR